MSIENSRGALRAWVSITMQALLLAGCTASVEGAPPSSEPPGTPPAIPEVTTENPPIKDGALMPLEPAKTNDVLPPTAARPSSPSCQFQKAEQPVAFCESFDAASPGGRGGDLDEKRIGITRLNGDQFGRWGKTMAVGCDETTDATTKLFPNDHYLCPSEKGGNHLRQAYDDGGGFTSFSMLVRQPFDFKDRTGTVAFDVDGWSTNDHGTWIELWLTDEPVPAPYQGGAGIQTTPRNAVGLEFKAATLAMNFVENSVSSIHLVKDYNIRSDLKAVEKFGTTFSTEKLKMNHFEIRINTDSVEVYVSDKDANEVHPVAKVTGLGLSFSRGYVHLQHSHYNAGKDHNVGVTHYVTHLWDNFAFDGPALLMPRFYDVEDSLVLDTNDGRTKATYALEQGQTATVSLAGVDVTNASATSYLNLMLFGFSPGRSLDYRLNGKSWRTFAHPAYWANAEYMWRTMSIPFDTSDLVGGANTLELRMQGGVNISAVQSISLTVMPTQ